MKLNFIILFYLLSISSCDLIHWDLDKIEYSNYEVASGPERIFAPDYKTEIIEQADKGYSWAGKENMACGLTIYQDNDSIFNLEILRQGYLSNFMYQDRDTILMALNGDSRVSLLQLGLDGNINDEYLDLVLYVDSMLGSVSQLMINDITRFADVYILAGELRQTIGEPRSILIGMTRSLHPIWVRTYISNSFATNVEISEDGEIYCSGIRNGHNYILKTNLEGNFFKIRDFNVLGRDKVSDMKYYNEALYFVSSFISYPFKTRIVSFNKDLNENWFIDLPTIDTNHPVLDVNRHGNLVIGYASYSILFLTELDSHFGSTIWCNRFAKDRIYSPKGIIQTQDYGYFMLTESTDGEQLVIKTDEEGATRLHPFGQYCQ